MNQLKTGIRVESEHKKTMNFIKNYYEKHDKLPANKLVFTHIAKDHIKENPRYYSKLKTLKL